MEKVYCPFCNQKGVVVTKSLKTVRNASRQGRAVSHLEEVLNVVSDCELCKKSKKEIESAFGL